MKRAIISVAASCGILAICLACSRPPPPAAPSSAPSDPEHEANLRAADAHRVALQRGHITTERDEFRATTVIRGEFALQGDMRLTLLTSTETSNLVGLLFTSTTVTWRYLRCHEVLALAGANPVPVGDFRREGEVRSGRWVVENIHGMVPFETFLQFVEAPSVRFRICNDVFEFNSAQRSALRVFAQAVIDTARADVDAGPADTPLPEGPHNADR